MIHADGPGEQQTPKRPCQSTQHCASWGWCRRCAPKLAEAGSYIVTAMSKAGVPTEVQGDVYGKIMVLLDAATAQSGCSTPETHNWGCACELREGPRA